jgi:hypothetical protein
VVLLQWVSPEVALLVGWLRSTDRAGVGGTADMPQGCQACPFDANDPKLPSGKRLLARLLITQSDFTDDLKIRLIWLKHEKFAHGHCVFEDDIGDVEIVGNHYQVRWIAMF